MWSLGVLRNVERERHEPYEGGGRSSGEEQWERKNGLHVQFAEQRLLVGVGVVESYRVHNRKVARWGRSSTTEIRIKGMKIFSLTCEQGSSCQLRKFFKDDVHRDTLETTMR